MHLLDTDMVIWHLRNKCGIVALVESLSQAGRLGISALTCLEVGVGVKEKERSSTRKFLAALKTYEVYVEIADMAAEFICRYQAQGITLDVADAVIAATAVVLDISPITLNAKHYPMPEVRLYFESR